MPSKSRKQHNLMEAAAHTEGGYDGVPQSVGKEFVKADKGKYQGKGAKNGGAKSRTGKTRSWTGA